MQSADGAPTFVYCVLKVPLLSKTWIRLLPPSATYTLPCASTAMAVTEPNIPVRCPFRAPGLDEHALAVEFGDARIAHSIGHENISGCIPRDIGGPVEHIALTPAPGRLLPTAGAGRHARREREWDDSGFLPSSIRTRPSDPASSHSRPSDRRSRCCPADRCGPAART